uniref:Uncharacterized protein n=1 Tax=Ficedula albicollis TaxID=59894 RepID=A0A803V7D6_FICAL
MSISVCFFPVFPEAEGFLARGLQEEPLSAPAREGRSSLLRSFQRLKSRWVFPKFPHPDPPESRRILGFLLLEGILRYF